MGASHQTTNELHRLTDVREVDTRVRAFNGTYSTCKKIGTMTFNHQGGEIHHQETLYDSSYGNIISGQRLSDRDVKVSGRKVQLLVNDMLLYEMEMDEDGAE